MSRVIRMSSDKPIQVNQLADEITQSVLLNARNWSISGYDITLNINEDSLTLPEIIDQMIETKYNSILNPDKKREMLRAIIKICNSLGYDGPRVTADSIWYYRNCTRFLIGLGCSYFMKSMSSSNFMYNGAWYMYHTEVPNPTYSKGELIMQLDNYLGSTDHHEVESLPIYVTTISQYLNVIIYVLHKFFVMIDPEHADRYDVLNPEYGQSDSSYKSFDKMEIEVIKTLEFVNRCLAEIGLDYRFVLPNREGYPSNNHFQYIFVRSE